MKLVTPLTSEELFSLLDSHNLEYQVTHHAPLMTVQDAKSIRSDAESNEGQIKNLFVHNKKGGMWLLTLHEDRQIDLKQTAIDIAAKRFSFCSSDRLIKFLGVLPGAVSPFALLNDRSGEVMFYFDKVLMDHPIIHAHPMDNRITVSIERRNLLDFLGRHGHPYKILD